MGKKAKIDATPLAALVPPMLCNPAPIAQQARPHALNGLNLQKTEAEKAASAERQAKAARQQLACAFGEAEALEPLSLEEIEEIASLALDGMSRLHERRSQLCRDARERAAAAGVYF